MRPESSVTLAIFICLLANAAQVVGISRAIADILGYDSTCSSSCSLSISCWLAGGRSGPGCGPPYLLTCCRYGDFKTQPHPLEAQELQSYPSKKIEDNVLRRRIDEDASQDECGVPGSKLIQKRIIGGREAGIAEYPWQAHVRISQFQCGGVLVSRMFVATAAHCVQKARPRDIAVWLGATDTSSNFPINSAFIFNEIRQTPPPSKHGVSQKILHPLFQFRITQPDRYDIALLRLTRAVRFTPFVLPICLPYAGLQLEGKQGIIAGWGKTDPGRGHSGTSRLRSAIVPIVSRERCIQWHSSKSIAVEIHPEMLCAGHPDGRQDACLGDSGGPLIVYDDTTARFTLVGITSAGFGCGVDHQPGIYHNVQITQSWIRRVMQN